MTTKQTPSILIVGATGNVGSELSKIINTKGIAFRALVRDPGKTGNLPALEHAQIVPGDLGNRQQIRASLEGIDRVFLLTNSSEEAETLQTNFLDEAKQSGIRHIVKLSQFAASTESPVRFLRYHAAVEQKIQASGMDYTFLRPNLYMQGLLGFRQLIASQGKFFAAIGDARISAIDVRDLAAVAAEALTGTGHKNKIYDLTGPEALTHEEMAVRLSEGTSNPIRFFSIWPDEMRQALLAVGFPVWQADGLIEDYAHYARGEASVISPAVLEVTGRSARTFAEFARDYAPLFS